MAKNKAPAKTDNTIARHRRASFEYALEERFEAGVVLEGWEVKSLRAGKANISQSYVIVKNKEAWLLGAQITPLISTSTHIKAEAERTRKLLLHASELSRLIGATEQKGSTIVPIRLYWARGKVKCEIALAKGKKLHDKRQTIKEREWNRNKQRILRRGNNG